MFKFPELFEKPMFIVTYVMLQLSFKYSFPFQYYSNITKFTLQDEILVLITMTDAKMLYVPCLVNFNGI